MIRESKLVTGSELESTLTISVGFSFLTFWLPVFYSLEMPLLAAIAILGKRVDSLASKVWATGPCSKNVAHIPLCSIPTPMAGIANQPVTACYSHETHVICVQDEIRASFLILDAGSIGLLLDQGASDARVNQISPCVPCQPRPVV